MVPVPVMVMVFVMVLVTVQDTVTVTVTVIGLVPEIVNLSCIKKLTYREVNYESNYSRRV